jgi:hypothetical protein
MVLLRGGGPVILNVGRDAVPAEAEALELHRSRDSVGDKAAAVKASAAVSMLWDGSPEDCLSLCEVRVERAM